MKTVGQILKEARNERGLGIGQAARATKIRPLYLEALEKDDYQKLPSATSTRGFIKNYAEYLGLAPEGVLAIFRRDFAEKKETDDGGPITSPRIAWSPKLTTILVGMILFLLFVGYLIWQYLSLINAPYY